mmetsp:Transcript_801/g.2900  ORF Transcript_801/g.2900 Transcript_801/m.2900 type:complete len:228 (-) Transcript_801:382-1065(-)
MKLLDCALPDGKQTALGLVRGTHEREFAVHGHEAEGIPQLRCVRLVTEGSALQVNDVGGDEGGGEAALLRQHENVVEEEGGALLLLGGSRALGHEGDRGLVHEQAAGLDQVNALDAAGQLDDALLVLGVALALVDGRARGLDRGQGLLEQRRVGMAGVSQLQERLEQQAVARWPLDGLDQQRVEVRLGVGAGGLQALQQLGVGRALTQARARGIAGVEAAVVLRIDG